MSKDMKDNIKKSVVKNKTDDVNVKAALNSTVDEYSEGDVIDEPEIEDKFIVEGVPDDEETVDHFVQTKKLGELDLNLDKLRSKKQNGGIKKAIELAEVRREELVGLALEEARFYSDYVIQKAKSKLKITGKETPGVDTHDPVSAKLIDSLNEGTDKTIESLEKNRTVLGHLKPVVPKQKLSPVSSNMKVKDNRRDDNRGTRSVVDKKDAYKNAGKMVRTERRRDDEKYVKTIPLFLRNQKFMQDGVSKTKQVLPNAKQSFGMILGDLMDYGIANIIGGFSPIQKLALDSIVNDTLERCQLLNYYVEKTSDKRIPDRKFKDKHVRLVQLVSKTINAMAAE